AVPSLCLNCHGGNYEVLPGHPPILDDLDMNASFREFDLRTFGYSGGREAGQFAQAELDAFKAQSGMGVATHPYDAVQELIKGWYAAGTSAPNPDFVPRGWADPNHPTQKDLYSGVVAVSCRTCHVALGNDIDWNTYAKFQGQRSSIVRLVCGKL